MNGNSENTELKFIRVELGRGEDDLPLSTAADTVALNSAYSLGHDSATNSYQDHIKFVISVDAVCASRILRR